MLDYSEFLPNESHSSPDNQLIAEGGTSFIFKTRIGSKYYIRKKLKPTLAEIAEFSDLLNREFEIGQHLNHPNIVQYRFLDESTFPNEIILDYIEGIPPLQYLESSKNFLQRLRRYASLSRQLLRLHAYLNEKKVTHSDISPSNFLVDEHDVLILFDFGHAQQKNWKPLEGGTRNFSLKSSEDEAFQKLALFFFKHAFKANSFLSRIALLFVGQQKSLKQQVRLSWLFSLSLFLLPLIFVSTALLLFCTPVQQTPKPRKASSTHTPLTPLKSEKPVLFSSPSAVSSPDPINKIKTETKTSLPKNAVLSSSQYDSDRYWGSQFWIEFQAYAQENPEASRRELFDKRNRLIIACNNQWRVSLERLKAQDSTFSFLDHMKVYNQAYYKAYLESEKLLDRP